MLASIKVLQVNSCLNLLDGFQHWTVGKIIDKIAEAAKLRNGNNLNTDTVSVI